ncbi:uncharacterized protein LOC114520814 [Dendronephthya gigantea]|uniref:uncharacterized protein LOC114520814 n=1 Tax=Dendronephthya gigantea TaxID=151771 RepID=UPI001069CB08|nr:uncharacterized protein LOC114520814 [Dendronephthya gigantea]
MKMQTFLHFQDRKRLEKIIKSAEEYTVMLKIIEPFKDKVDVHVTTRIESCIPRKPQTFLGRDAEVNRITTSLMKNNCGIVSIVGEPGFGKSTVAIEVSHHISQSTVVIYSFLSNTSTVSEVIVRLCHDVGIVPGEDPESSLLSWLKSIEKKVVLVMDNVQQLLGSDVKPQFIELLLTLRKKSPEYLQILTTSRTEFQIPGQTVVNHQLQVLDVKSSIELLRKCCADEKIEDIRLSELANLCGFVPLALCVAGTLIPNLDDPSELVQWLRENPIEASSDSKQCVLQKVIEFSFQKLSDDDKKALVCLSVFDGNFETIHAKKVIERSTKLETLEFLKNLVCRGLIQGTDDTNFVIHPFVRRFLADHDHFQFEKAIAQGLMVKHFLTMCHSLTRIIIHTTDLLKPENR